MPVPKKATKKQKAKIKRCEKKLKGIKGINRFAVCRASVLGKKKRRKKRKKVRKR